LEHLVDKKGASEVDMAIRRSKTQADTPRFGRLDADMADVESAISRSAEFLLSQQDPEGYWCGDLEAATPAA
jgi:squalene-hopene/tetraprenyl-beta-curcumene cyclase